VKKLQKRAISLLAVVAASLSLVGCTALGKNEQDKAACDKISEILVATGQSVTSDPGQWGKTALRNEPAEPVEVLSLSDRIEQEALPLASMTFAETLQSWIKAIRNVDSKSIFDSAAGLFGTTDKFIEVSARCIELGSAN
jgi:hypothetical protein